jgi:hypothetical protein
MKGNAVPSSPQERADKFGNAVVVLRDQVPAKRSELAQRFLGGEPGRPEPFTV